MQTSKIENDENFKCKALNVSRFGEHNKRIEIERYMRSYSGLIASDFSAASVANKNEKKIKCNKIGHFHE